MAQPSDFRSRLQVQSVHLLQGELPRSVKRRIANGLEISLTWPQVIYILTIIDAFSQVLDAIAQKPSKDASAFLLTCDGNVLKQYEVLLSSISKWSKRYCEEEMKITHVVKGIFEKLDKLLPTDPRIKLFCAPENDVYFIDLRQAVELVTLGKHYREFVLELPKDRPTLPEIQTGSQLEFPALKTKLSGEQCEQGYLVLDRLVLAVPKDEINRPKSEYASPSGWQLYGTTDPSSYMGTLEFKNPKAIEILLPALRACGFQANYMKKKGALSSYLTVLLKCDALSSKKEMQQLMLNADKAKRGILQAFKEYQRAV